MKATLVCIIVDSIIAILFVMNLVSSEIMLPSTIPSAPLSLICASFDQAFTEVNTKLLNSAGQLNVEKFTSQNKEIPSYD